VDDADLRRIAEVSGGRFYRSDNSAALEQIYAEIDELERTKTEEQSHVEWGELSWPWLLGGFACLVLLVLLDSTWLRKIP
jgi:Ca-activated chloride channel family protein